MDVTSVLLICITIIITTTIYRFSIKTPAVYVGPCGDRVVVISYGEVKKGDVYTVCVIFRTKDKKHLYVATWDEFNKNYVPEGLYNRRNAKNIK